jgi:type IV secretory pathway TrbF-like protein
VSIDPGVAHIGWNTALWLTTVRGQSMVGAYLKPIIDGNDTSGRASADGREGTVTVEVMQALKMTESSWQVDWKEHIWDMHGKPAGDSMWRGVFHVKLHMPADEEGLAKNPTGMFVDEFHWVKLHG